MSPGGPSLGCPIMVRAYFNIRLDDSFLPERMGQWVADLDAARVTARTIVRRLVLQHGGEPRLLDAVMVVSDPDGATLLEMSFFEALYLPVEPALRADAPLRRPSAPRPVGFLSEARIGGALRPIRRFAEAVNARVQPLIGN